MTEPTIKASNESDENEFQLEDGDDIFLEAQNELNKDKWTARRAMIGAMLANFCVGNYFLYGDYNGEVAEWLEMKDHTITE